jgi:hypothetical protein
VKGFNNERVVMISCGWKHSMALTECGHVYSWGSNEFGQLGIGNTVNSNESKFVAVIDENKCDVFIEKISCGSEHSLLLSSDGFIYVLGRNKDGELGNQKQENISSDGFIYALIRNFFRESGNQNELSPHRIKIETKFIDISSRWDKYISIALSQDGIYYNWGKCGEEIIRTPKPTNFESFVEIYAKYFKITQKAINFEEENGEKVKANKTDHNLGSSANRFNSQPNETSSRYKSEFEELKFIGSGGFGKVYKVINCLDQQQYAIKIITIEGISFHYFRNFFQCI